MINLIYNSENYYVVAYPDQHAYELVDKRSGRGAFFQGDVAARFVESMQTTVAEDASITHVDEFLDSFDGQLNFQVVVH